MRFLFTLATLAYVALASTTPAAVRLAYVPSGMSVSWSTESVVSNPVVAYGLSSTSLSTVSGQSNTYGTQYFHTVVLNDLKPKTKYYYQVLAADSSSTNSPIRSFTTANAPGDLSEFNAFIIGDMGMKNSADVMASMKDLQDTTDFVLHIGDISYADDWYLRPGMADSNTYEKTWVNFQLEMESVTANKAYMVEPGNHEATCTEVTPFACPENQRNFTAYNSRYRMPSLESGGVANMWYSFDFGSAHFIQLSTETDFKDAPEGPGTYLASGPFGDQLSWFQADLESAQKRRSQVPWIIVSGHRPLYSSGGVCSSCIAAFEELMLKYNVDIYFAGHVHYYEKMWPIANGAVTQKNFIEPTGIVHIISGAGGNVEGLSKPGRIEPYTALINDVVYGYGRLTVHNSSDVTWDFIEGKGNKLIDTFSIHKTH